MNERGDGNKLNPKLIELTIYHNMVLNKSFSHTNFFNTHNHDKT